MKSTVSEKPKTIRELEREGYVVCRSCWTKACDCGVNPGYKKYGQVKVKTETDSMNSKVEFVAVVLAAIWFVLRSMIQ